MKNKNIKIEGIAAAPGIAIGPAYKLGKEEFSITKDPIEESQISLQIQLFEEALIKTRREILSLQDRISHEMGQDAAEIFEAHLLVLEDRMLIEEIISRLKKEKINVAYIFSEVLKKYVKVFANIEDEYLRERVTDINDVGKRVLRNLLGGRKRRIEELKEPVIIVAHDLSPSDTASMHKKNVMAFITDIGGKTSHTAIMAKSLEIPAVVGLQDITKKVNSADILIVDGANGKVIINPDDKTKEEYRREEQQFINISEKFSTVKTLPAQTLDGKRVRIVANIELPEEVDSVKQHGAEGIGLYRTEFFYMNRKDLPSEEEHYQAYRYVAEQMQGGEVVIRTIDLGGDKFISQLQVPHDMLPFLGWRAIRFCLARPDIFKVQLKAILRASAHGNLKIMYPMISGVEEFKQANLLLDKCKQELKDKNIAFDQNLEVGAMIELPSAALTADLLAKEAVFFSIGTNDLIQYSLAVDRTNEKVAYLYEPAHPAVLRMIKSVIDAAHNARRWVAMCGEMAGDPIFIPILLGLGLDEFSMPSAIIPEVKYLIRAIKFEDAKLMAQKALSLSEGREVEEFCKEWFNQQIKK